ncbi:sulfatase-like hydrolase/transferase [Roseiconus nitratireducens]|uniref:Sulfatase-like hydrolase/transferase n=1 Tax=Roseiconus nitratireducens TaxID=2605748 RepID=A0A5M6D0C1_9BACT|nr:sulfatase-like hydrolase/transferase [Roseiconus nitratireducens]KAA5540927.1 sulfatase-like hydrolase/transferase [Roseiconus nitratireducens]
MIPFLAKSSRGVESTGGLPLIPRSLRLRFSHVTAWTIAILFLPSLARIAVQAESPQRPNIVLILADDLGYGDVGFNGCADIPTPNIDSLARDGVRFANGYSSHPFCSPMRAGLMTAKYQHRFGYVNNVAFDPHNQLMGLPTDQPTVAKRLSQAGYRTGMVGKWHLGAAAPFHPLRRGFDFFYGFLGGGHDYFQVDTTVQLHENYKAALDDNGKPAAFDGYLTEVLTDKALGFLQSADERPYFLYVAYNAPHGPLQAPEEEIAKFDSIKNRKRRIYAAMVSVMDQQIGRLLAALRDRGETENTLVMFLSDNGGPEHANASDNGPLRGQKGDVYEGGIHVPFVMCMPGTLPAGTVFSSPVLSIDLAQTALDLAGAPSESSTDGVNLMPFVLDSESAPPHDALFWRTAGDRKLAVRRGDHKLVMLDGDHELYDLTGDLEESRDLSGSDPQTVQRLQRSFESWNRRNQPAFFPGYRDYHQRLKEFHQQLREEARETDSRYELAE